MRIGITNPAVMRKKKKTVKVVKGHVTYFALDIISWGHSFSRAVASKNYLYHAKKKTLSFVMYISDAKIKGHCLN